MDEDAILIALDKYRVRNVRIHRDWGREVFSPWSTSTSELKRRINGRKSNFNRRTR